VAANIRRCHQRQKLGDASRRRDPSRRTEPSEHVQDLDVETIWHVDDVDTRQPLAKRILGLAEQRLA
jgi:hypothetical protein